MLMGTLDGKISRRSVLRTSLPLALLGLAGEGMASSVARRETGQSLPEGSGRYDDEALGEIDRLGIEALHGIPVAGLSIGVEVGSKVVHANGYGYAELQHGVKAQAQTIYGVGSITKQFTAATILSLCETGILSLDLDLRELIPEFDTKGREVTVKHLLNHTSGIRDLTKLPDVMSNRCLDVSQSTVIESIQNEKYNFEPGEAFQYNNSGFWLLGVIIERLTASSFAEYLEEIVLRKVGMNSTYYDSYRDIIPDRARGYQYRDKKFVHSEVNSPSRPFSSGAMLSTVGDLLSWNRELHSHQIIGEEYYGFMTEPTKLNSGKMVPWGFGLRIDRLDKNIRYTHGGEIIGYQGVLSFYPERNVGVAVLANTQRHSKAPPLADLEKAVAMRFL